VAISLSYNIPLVDTCSAPSPWLALMRSLVTRPGTGGRCVRWGPRRRCSPCRCRARTPPRSTCAPRSSPWWAAGCSTPRWTCCSSSASGGEPLQLGSPVAFHLRYSKDAIETPFELAAPPKVDSKCTTPSLIPTVNGSTVRSFSTHGQQSAANGSSTTVSRSDIRLTQHLDSSFGPEVARLSTGYFPIHL
jgi:hypothetical protein